MDNQAGRAALSYLRFAVARNNARTTDRPTIADITVSLSTREATDLLAYVDQLEGR